MNGVPWFAWVTMAWLVLLSIIAILAIGKDRGKVTPNMACIAVIAQMLEVLVIWKLAA